MQHVKQFPTHVIYLPHNTLSLAPSHLDCSPVCCICHCPLCSVPVLLLHLVKVVVADVTGERDEVVPRESQDGGPEAQG